MRLKGIGLLSVLMLSACATDDVDRSAPGDVAPHDVARVQQEARTQADQEFTCDTQAVTTDTLLATIKGAGQESLLIVPTGNPCRYHLLVREADGKEHMLSGQPGMTFLAAGLSAPVDSDPARVVVCWTDFLHANSPSKGNRAPSRVQRRITSVDVVCRVRENDQWQPIMTVADSAAQNAAAWLDGLVPDDTAPGAVRVVWARDSTFSYLNGEAQGRPAADGMYAAVIVPASTVSTPEKVGSLDWDIDVSVQ